MITGETKKRKPIPVPAILGLDTALPPPDRYDRFFFKSPLIAQRLALLNNMVGGSSLVIAVIGERGSGKTSLMRQFIADTRHQWQEGRIKIRRQVPTKQWHNLNNRVVFFSRKKGLPSILIDDAHQLSPLELKLLLQYAAPADGPRRIQSIVLLAEPQMRERFAEIARWLPPKSVVDKIFMTPLTERQTSAYLEHRIKAAGILRNNPFSSDQIHKIYERSGGLPGWINGEAFLLLKNIAKHRQGFKRSLITALTAGAMRKQYQLRTWIRFSLNSAVSLTWCGKRRQECIRC
jgi:type II secretory pathway predicted ATPase ExeA